MQEAVIVDAIRTPIGRAMRGSLKTVRADELAAIPIRALMQRNRQVDFSQTVDVLMGSASGIGEQGYNVGRNAALLAGLDHHVPGCTVNRFCASSLMTIRMAFHAGIAAAVVRWCYRARRSCQPSTAAASTARWAWAQIAAREPNTSSSCSKTNRPRAGTVAPSSNSSGVRWASTASWWLGAPPNRTGIAGLPCRAPVAMRSKNAFRSPEYVAL